MTLKSPVRLLARRTECEVRRTPVSKAGSILPLRERGGQPGSSRLRDMRDTGEVPGTGAALAETQRIQAGRQVSRERESPGSVQGSTQGIAWRPCGLHLGSPWPLCSLLHSLCKLGVCCLLTVILL